MPRRAPGADSAAGQLRVHEAVCAERYGKIMGLLDAALHRIGRLEVLVVIVAGSMIVGMAGLIITLALKLGRTA